MRGIDITLRLSDCGEATRETTIRTARILCSTAAKIMNLLHIEKRAVQASSEETTQNEPSTMRCILDAKRHDISVNGSTSIRRSTFARMRISILRHLVSCMVYETGSGDCAPGRLYERNRGAVVGKTERSSSPCMTPTPAPGILVWMHSTPLLNRRAIPSQYRYCTKHLASGGNRPTILPR